MKNILHQEIKGICVIFVIVIHTLYNFNFYTDIFNIVVRSLINFCVPLFFFFSGYYCKINNYKFFLKSKVKRILLPLFIWSFIYLGFYIFRNLDVIHLLTFKSLLFKFLFGKSAIHLYYLYVLFFLYLITPLLKKIFCTKKNFIFLIIFNALYYFVLEHYIISFNYIGSGYQYIFLCWISYYVLGLYFKNNNLKKEIKSYQFVLLLFLFVCSLIESLFIYFTYSNIDLALSVNKLFSFLFNLYFCYIINLFNWKKNNSNFLINLGNYSFGIYLSHILILEIVRKCVSIFNMNYYFNIILIMFLTVLISFILNKCYYRMEKKL